LYNIHVLNILVKVNNSLYIYGREVGEGFASYGVPVRLRDGTTKLYDWLGFIDLEEAKK